MENDEKKKIEKAEVSVKEKVAEPKVKPAKPSEKVLSPDWVVKKIEKIENSKMPEKQKREYIAKLQGKVEDSSDKVPFHVYARIRKHDQHLHKAMQAYPAAKNIRLASLSQWDEIFKNF
jgi:hypothetical protein